MSTTATVDDPDPQEAALRPFLHSLDSESLNYLVTHVFFPENLPTESDYTLEKDLSLVRAVYTAARAYSARAGKTSESQWNRIMKMLDNLQTSIRSEHLDRDLVMSQLCGMKTGDLLAFFFRTYNFGIILARRETSILSESFEVSLDKDVAEKIVGSLECSYPRFSIEISQPVSGDWNFQFMLASLLCGPRSHDKYVEALHSTFHGVRHATGVPSIDKRIRDHTSWSYGKPGEPGKPTNWRRSSLWLFIRVVIQMSIDRSPGRASYKAFMLFFICTIARDITFPKSTVDAGSLHFMGCKILQRWNKLGTSTTDWLSQVALKTCASLRGIIDDGWMSRTLRPSPFRNPSQDELERDTQLSLKCSKGYIHNVLENAAKPFHTPFHPSHYRRGALDDFLSSNGSFFEEAYRIDRETTLRDVENAVEEGLDDWIACVTDVDKACLQLKMLMDKYMVVSKHHYAGRHRKEYKSILLLTEIELFIALDKLAVEEIPILVDYSPEVPPAVLETLSLNKASTLHRVSRAYQYLFTRKSRSRLGWSTLSEEFSEDSLPVRYYDRSSYLQRLKVRIEEDAMVNRDGPYGDSEPQLRQDGNGADVPLSPLPSSPSHAKVIVFELQCPTCIRTWRSAAARIWYSFHTSLDSFKRETDENLLSGVARLWQYSIGGNSSLNVQTQFTYRWSGNNPTLRYTAQHPNDPEDSQVLSIWIGDTSVGDWWPCILDPLRDTSNDVMDAQVKCPTGLSLDEFIALRRLESCFALRWLNVLHGIRSGSPNLRRDDFAHAVLEVGPLDSNTGELIWHQELQNPSFCNALLDELEDLSERVGAGTIDAVMMGTISLLLTRVLASSPGEVVSERAITLLRAARRKTFDWVLEASYNVGKDCTLERHIFLHEMSVACRRTFAIDPIDLRKTFQSIEDIVAALSCAIITRGSNPRSMIIRSTNVNTLADPPGYPGHYVVEILSDIIPTDASNWAIDLAVCEVFPSHRPCASRWEHLQYPNTCWITCQSRGTIGQSSRTAHLNLLTGELQVDGEGLVRLYWLVNQGVCGLQAASYDQSLFTLPGMDSACLSMMPKYKADFSLRGHDVIVRMQYDDSKDIFESLPRSILAEDLPDTLGYGGIHWLNLSTGIIEVRPFQRPWERSAENWRISNTSGQYRAYKGHETLVDIDSPTVTTLLKCLGCLYKEVDRHRAQRDLFVTMCPVGSPPTPRLCAKLSSHGLSFSVNNGGEFESHDFKDMVYDDQSIETLYGSQDLLILRPKAHLPEGLLPRLILTPPRCGEFWSQYEVCTKMTYDDQRTGGHPYHTYVVDTELGCLIGSGSWTSTAQLAEMHGMTSWYRSDPLTGKTGPQAACCLLQSGGCWSIAKRRGSSEWDLDLDREWNPDRYRRESNRHRLPGRIEVTAARIIDRYYWTRGTSISRIGEEQASSRTACLFSWLLVPPTPHFLSQRHTLDNPWQINLDLLFSSRSPPELPPRSISLRIARKTSSDDPPQLDRLFTFLGSDESCSFRKEYISQLNISAQRLREDSRITHTLVGKGRIDILKKHHARCKLQYTTALTAVKERLGPSTNPLQQMLQQFSQWPPVTGDVLLRCLASTSSTHLPNRWKKCLVSLALLLLDVQRARRLLRFALDGLEEELSMELGNDGCDGWDPEVYPDWLLIQIQGNFLIRRAQAEIAMEIISPKSGRNTIMQVKMGEGKSSIIIPIAAAALADGEQLARVIVPKALTAQMFEILVTRLGGLVNRPIYHLPFSRKPEYDRSGRLTSLQIDDLHKLMSQCMAERGVVIMQPEYVASLKLRGVEEQLHKGIHAADLEQKDQLSIYMQTTPALLLRSLPQRSLMGNIPGTLSQQVDYSGEKSIARVGHFGENNNDLDDSNKGASGISDSASKWLCLLNWLDCHVRDILDESDEVLHPGFQLIYTMGFEKHVDGYPDRWTITREILRLVKECVHTLARNYPDSVKIGHGPPGSFPHVDLTQASDIGQRLISMIVGNVMDGRVSNLNFHNLSPELHGAIRSFISDEEVLQVPDTAKRVEEYARRPGRSRLWSGLLLLRGLLASNVLLFALTKRRWRVDYGVALHSYTEVHGQTASWQAESTKLAVPYRAKDMPALNTEFGHPDITIILTCLSYYYSGLDDEQLRKSFQMLIDEDDPYAEYTVWVKDHVDKALPDSLRALSEINLHSSEQWDKVIFPLFSRNQATIDFYLSRMVFPEKPKEFPWKLVASSWDLAEKRKKVITGFSGSNDNRWLLPMSIAQRDLDHQLGTNARVLSYILRPENDFYASTHKGGKRLTSLEFLKMLAIQQPEIRVLLDVGAQILDLSNLNLAKAWLDIAPDVAGAVYFDTDDKLMVLMRNGSSMPMLSSPLSGQLGRCVIYLDHVHTRGTDIKFPTGSRAAVTLGPKLTKDRLVQGCMRMRKLGRGHSIMFFAPPEVNISIRSLTSKKGSNDRITAADVLFWAIHETWTDIQRRAPYWAQQGMDHKSRQEAWSRFCNGDITPERLSKVWLQPASRSLEDLYAPREGENHTSALSTLDPAIRQRCKDLGILSLPGAQIDEEQEREVSREREREREVELPPKAEPAEHFLHPDVATFVKTGAIPPLNSSNAFHPVFTTLGNTTAATREADVWSPYLLATTDFCNTIKPRSTKGTVDQYLRPVQWVLSSKKDGNEVLVLLSPFEVNSLMPEIRESEHVHLHLYAPRTSLRMKPCDDLKLYSIPPLPSTWAPPWALIDQLNVFAGQPYLRDHQSYQRLCRFLELPTEEVPDDATPQQSIIGGSDKNGKSPGSTLSTVTAFYQWLCRFLELPMEEVPDDATPQQSITGGSEKNGNSPGSMLFTMTALLAIRNRGRPLAHTHMGKILYGHVLREKDFDIPQPITSGLTSTTLEETWSDTASETKLLSPMSMDSPVGPEQPASLASSKRKLEMDDIADVDSQPKLKRLRWE